MQRGGQQLGSIIITNAQIGRQNRPSDSTDDRDFRHAFLIIETARKGSPNRHVLCAESDSERDSWIEMLVQRIDPNILQPPTASSSASPPNGLARRRSNSRKSSKDVIVTAAQPLSTMPSAGSKFANAPSPSLINSMESQRQAQPTPPAMSTASASTHESRSPSQPLTGDTTLSPPGLSTDRLEQAPPLTRPVTIVTNPSNAWPSTPAVDPKAKATKRQSHVPPKQQYTSAYLSKLSSEGLSAPPGHSASQDKERERKAKSGRFWSNFGRTPDKIARPVFGVQLMESIQIASVAGLPAPVFRCIEYLEAKRAEEEEGIYRLSGSSAVIKGLKDRFDAEGDVNLLRLDEHWDPHAVAGLMKTYLRELPSSLLTKELHPRFLAVMGR
jgi:RalA-binding protein 1